VRILSAGQEEAKAYSKRYLIEEGGVTYRVVLYYEESAGYDTAWFVDEKRVEIPESVREKANEEEISVGYYLELMEEEGNK
jgi:hypothetical protein